MNTKQAGTETASERMNTSYERLRASMADLKTDMAQRENRQLLATLGGIAVATTILGVLIAGIPAA